MSLEVLLGVSALLQFAAAGLAIRLIFLTGNRWAWILIAAAITLMGIRRSITLFHLVSGDVTQPPQVAAELVALVISILMLAGLAWVAPFFMSIQRRDDELRKVNRALRTLSECNHKLVRAETESELFQQICRVIVETGGYRFAWVGWAEHDAAKTLRPLAQAGYEDGYLDTLNLTWADEERGRGPTGTAIRTGKTQVVREILTEPGSEPSRAAAAERPYTSCVALPLIAEGRVLGALSVYAAEPDAFDREEVELLTQLADELVYAVVAVRTGAERERVEEELRRSEAQYRSLVEHAVYGIYRTTAEGKIVAANPALAAMLGYDSEEELLKLDLSQDVYVDPQDRARLLRHAESSDRVKGFEANVKRKDGRVITVRISAQVVRDEEGRVLGLEGIAEDVTDRARLESELRQAQKLESVGQLTGGVAHDFNNLLSVILGNAQLLAGALTHAQGELREELEEIVRAAERGAAMVAKLLGFSRRTALNLAPTDLRRVVADAAGTLTRLIPENVEIRTDLTETAATVRADAGAVEQILLNLATNARDAMPDGGRLDISLRSEVIIQSDADSHPRLAPGEYVCLVVADTGSGMDEETKARLFEPFFTTKPEGKGTGLGMAMIYGLVEQHEGFVQVESEVGVGTTVKVGFVAVREHAATPVPEEGGVEVVGGTETILLVEDDDAVRRTGERVLKTVGYNVLTAADGEEGLELLRLRGPEIDLVISDGVMPKMGGHDLYRAMRRAGIPVKFLLASGYAESPPEEGAQDVEIPFVRKPFLLPDFLRRVRSLLDAPMG